MNASDSRIYICKVICKCIAVKNYEGVHKRTDVMRVIGRIIYTGCSIIIE